MFVIRLFLASAVLALAGCVSYTTPGGGVSLPSLTQAETPVSRDDTNTASGVEGTPAAEADIREAMASRPAAQFPAHVMFARIQAPGYRSESRHGYGSGSYSVVTTREVETEADVARIESWPGIAQVGGMSRLLLPSTLTSTKELRIAAAQLHADIVLLYTFDTSFRTDRMKIGPMQVISLGLLPSRKSEVTTTCAAAFVDVRTGYVYGIAEASATEAQRSDLWSTKDAIERARLRAEQQAFSAALGEIGRTWKNIYARFR